MQIEGSGKKESGNESQSGQQVAESGGRAAEAASSNQGATGQQVAGIAGPVELPADSGSEVAVQQVVEAIAQLAPIIAKSGFKSSEFWLLVLAIAGQVALTLGNKLSGELASVLTMTGSGIYLFVRTYHKADAAGRIADLLQGGALK